MAGVAGRWNDDPYTRRARREGYPARSVYKLEELQQRFRVIPPKARVLDVGAAPGSWTMFAAGRLGATVVAVDLQPLEIPRRVAAGVTVIQGDLREGSVAERLIELGPYEAVLSDAAPATTGNRTVDAAASEDLASAVVDLALACVTEGGAVVLKVLQGGAERALLGRLRKGFQRVKTLTPRATRRGSTETYLVAVGRKPTQPAAK
jgi:23S rRNA (uridine2552-2'-O)-methyltransferase